MAVLKVIEIMASSPKSWEDANAIAQKAVTPEKWKTFKSEFELRIKANEIRVTELDVKMKKPGERFDALYEKKC
jgi:flavin-binding protein dodecin